MRIVRLKISWFRCIRDATLYPDEHNVFLGPNNIGKTAILEAMNLLLNPEGGTYRDVVDENDFYNREYYYQTDEDEELEDEEVEEDDEAILDQPKIRIEAVITGIKDDDMPVFSDVLVPWDATRKEVREWCEEGSDAFDGAEKAIQPCFEAWYDPDEDDFTWRSFFISEPGRETTFTKTHKRLIGFLIYRDFRALQRPITLEPFTLFSRLLQSQEALPKHYEDILDGIDNVSDSLFKDKNFSRVVHEYKEELSRYLPISKDDDGQFSFELTDRTRKQLKAAIQLYVDDAMSLPLQKMGAGTRSLSILSILMLIARKRKRGIIALEEPETFLFPHAQRRVIDEAMIVASQTFVTTHSPYVLERMPIESYQRLRRDYDNDTMEAIPIAQDLGTAKALKRRLRKQLGEAILGNGAIVVEEDSMALWIQRVSTLMHGNEYDGEIREALELQGISVIACGGNADVLPVTDLLRTAGVNAIAFLDKVNDTEHAKWRVKHPVTPIVFMDMKGLESLLIRELPESILRKALVEGPHVKVNIEEEEIDDWKKNGVFKKNTKEFLKHNKGSIPFHEWFVEQIDYENSPDTLCDLIVLTFNVLQGKKSFTTHTLGE